MKFVILAALATMAFAAPQNSHVTPVRIDDSQDVEAIVRLRDDTLSEEDLPEHGIRVLQGESSDSDDAVVKAVRNSSVIYTVADGTELERKLVANENGFQPLSVLLPVAPEFPQPIPQFVRDQIAFATKEVPGRAHEGSFKRSSKENGTTLDDTKVVLEFIANERGLEPRSDPLQVAP